jgi:hypothetical protein
VRACDCLRASVISACGIALPLAVELLVLLPSLRACA